MLSKNCCWQDSNPRPLVSEATTLSTVPQRVKIVFLHIWHNTNYVWGISLLESRPYGKYSDLPILYCRPYYTFETPIMLFLKPLTTFQVYHGQPRSAARRLWWPVSPSRRNLWPKSPARSRSSEWPSWTPSSPWHRSNFSLTTIS